MLQDSNGVNVSMVWRIDNKTETIHVVVDVPKSAWIAVGLPIGQRKTNFRPSFAPGSQTLLEGCPFSRCHMCSCARGVICLGA
jgi:hypothetical protein